ncbi:uncharacterized protein [Amphiura filiformis]|uniref:uncharacterized protein n=1 Tax=Amphiura filiformis TaxID=82378 RepID=UPI003B217F38
MATVFITPWLVILCFYLPLIDAAQTRVSISSPTSHVTVGGILTIQCQVWDIQDAFNIHMYRVSNERTEQIINGEEIVRSTERLNMFLATRTFSDGSAVYFVTITDVTKNEQGEYLCKFFDITKFAVTAEDSINVEIYSLPSNGYPICSSVPNQPVALNIGDRLMLKCTSEKGVPGIQIKWLNAKSAEYLTSTETIQDHLVYSEVFTDINESLQGALFNCEITSEGFPDWKRSCTIGPIRIIYNNAHADVMNPKTGVSNKGIDESRHTGNPRLSGKCGECSSSNDILEFYLTVATVGTGLLSIVFIVTTIMMCHKYHTISEQTRIQPSRVLTTQQSVEPVYVSLQRRPQSTYSEREYMTLEDPNNPENKIILPKETFDDYCRTMSLKRV